MKNKLILTLVSLFSMLFLASIFKLSDDIQRKEEILESKTEVINVTDSIKTQALVTSTDLNPEKWALPEIDDSAWKSVQIPQYKMIQEKDFKEGNFGIYRITIPQEEIAKLKKFKGQVEFNPQYILFSDFDIYVNGKYLRSNSPTTGSESITGIPVEVGRDNLVAIKGKIKTGDTGIQHRGKMFLGKAATLNELHLSAYKGNYVFPLLFILSKGSVIFVFGLIYLLLNVERFFEKSLLFSLCAIGEDILTGDFLASVLTIHSRVYIYNFLNIGANIFLFLFLGEVVGKGFPKKRVYGATLALGVLSYVMAADILHTAYVFNFNTYLQFWNFVAAGVILYYLPKVIKQDKVLFLVMSVSLTLTMWSTFFSSNVGLNYKMLGNLLLFFMVAYQSFALFRREQLQLVEQEKDVAIGRTASLLAHDVRRPLEQMRFMLEKVSRGDISQDFLKEAREEVDFSITSVNNQINEIMNFSRTRSVELAPVSFYRVLSGSLKQVMTINKQLNISLLYDLKAQVKIVGDESRLAGALSNLLSNAVEAIRDIGKSEVGTIHLSTRVEGSKFIFKILNDGPLISEEHLDKIFSPLFTAGKDRGTGLGLASVAKAIHDHKGSISVKNIPSKGVEFTMTFSGTGLLDLPEAYRMETSSDKYGHETQDRVKRGDRPLRIFLLDDDVQVHEYFQYLVKNLSFDVELTFFTHYESAVEAVNDKRFDLYILDYDLGSDKTGVDFFHENLSFLSLEVVIHSNRDKVEPHDVKFNLLKKPMSFEELSELCEKVYDKRLKILLVDDGHMTLMAWEMYHGSHNIQVVDTPEGALKLLQKGSSYDLCVLDYYFDNSSYNGETLALKIKEVQNEMRIVLASTADLEVQGFSSIQKHQFEVRSLK
jgi:signal transduction histidine kinase